MAEMESGEAGGRQERQQLIAERRKWQTEIENKKRQLEDDRRALQHLKSKALRERWLLDGAPSAGPEQDQAKRQLEQDEAKTRSLEDAICRLEKELVTLETEGVGQSIIQTTVTSESAGEVKGHSNHQVDTPAASGQVEEEVKVRKDPQMSNARESTGEIKRAMYSVEIKVERDKVTGETRVLSTHTKLPVDLSHQGVKVYEDERKVVHEMNAEDGIHLLSSSEVEELIHKADEASMMSETVASVTSLQTAEVPEGLGQEPAQVTTEITGLETEADGQPSVAEASEEKPVTMVFMGYQSVEDEDETKKVLGLQGTVKAELVLIEDTDGKTPPGAEKDAATTQPAAPPVCTKPPERTAASNGKTGAELKKEKQPCKCCTIM